LRDIALAWLAWLSISAFWGLLAWQAWRGIRQGKVMSRFGDADRRENPFSFWLLFPIYLIGALIFPMVLIAILPLGK
jgi:hypothetical protein